MRPSQRFPFEVLHHQVVGADIVQRTDVGMVERGNRARLCFKPLGKGFAHDFYRDLPPQPGIDSLVNLAHTAGGDEPDNAESLRQQRPLGKLPGQGLGLQRKAAHGRPGKKGPRLVVFGEQPLHLGAYACVRRLFLHE
jgi:hypothetical protein